MDINTAPAAPPRDLKKIGVRDAANRLSSIVDEVQYQRGPVEITRRGKPVAILIAHEHFEVLMRTLDGLRKTAGEEDAACQTVAKYADAVLIPPASYAVLAGILDDFEPELGEQVAERFRTALAGRVMPAIGDNDPLSLVSPLADIEKTRRCSMCDAWYDPLTEAAEHAHVLPQSGPLRDRWIASRLSWAEFHDTDPEAKAWGHRGAPS